MMTVREYKVLEFGATGNGKSMDTQAIQRAIDECNKAGGGTIYFPPGEYLIGTLYHRSNVRLYLEANARIQGSGNIDDYEKSTLEDRDGMPPAFAGGYLIYAEGIENAAIEGRGTIDGSGRAFWTSDKCNAYVVAPKEKRPRSLIYMVNCRDLLFRDITLANSPCYTLWLLGCDTVNIDGISILNPHDGPNTDGLDIDCCRNVRITGCHIDAGDDCIAVKSDSNRLGERLPCENITVTNCTMSSSACAVRLGYEGDAPIRNCTFSNLAIYNTHIGIDIISVIPSRRWFKINEGTLIDGIVFDNIVMQNVVRPIYMWLGNETGDPLLGRIQNIKISNVIAYAKNACYIGGCEEARIEGVELNNIKLIMQGGIDEPDMRVPDVWGGSQHPYGLLCRYISGLKLHNLHIDWRQATGNWRNQILAENVEGIEIDNFGSEHFQSVSHLPAVHLHDAQRAFIRGCWTDTVDTFLAVDGEACKDISLIGNELSRAETAFELNGLEDGVLFETANHIS